jgi:hypothetical protein
MCSVVKVDVIIAVYNAQDTIKETVKSAMHQEIPAHLQTSLSNVEFDVVVCCYNDASTDKSIEILNKLKKDYDANASLRESKLMETTLLIGTAAEGTSSRGAGYARNQAVKLRDMITPIDDDAKCFHFLCILDSDDIMHPTRIAEQTSAMLSLGYGQHGKHLSEKALMGCQFDRIPNDSTWHYATWANSLSDERVVLEQFRECTLLQPTWFLSKSWLKSLGDYVESPITSEERDKLKKANCSPYYRLVHSSELNCTSSGEISPTLRIAEDTRLFYAHIRAGGTLHLHRTSAPLVSYRHRVGMSQSSETPRKLLIQLRAKAWEDIVFFGTDGSASSWSKRGFAIWGAGRDGKEFLKALAPEVASRVICFVDVDSNKIEKIKFYDNPSIGRKIPILHFSMLAKNPNACNVDSVVFGRVTKEKNLGEAFDTNTHKRTISKCEEPKRKKQKTRSKAETMHATSINQNLLKDLPVVVCVAMYRTSGALESNVASIGRKEGKDLWHIS